MALLGNGDETSRAALLEAAANPEAKVRVAAIEGLAKLKRDDATEVVFRAAWNNPKEAYGARKAALRGLVAWKVKDADQLLDEALKIPADRHSIAATALELLLQTPGPKARELAALYSQYGQPRALRSEAVGAFGRLAKDDESLQDIVVTLVDDPDRSVRFRAWGVVRELKLKKAVPALKARVGLESIGFSGFAQRMLEETLEALKESETKTASPGPAARPPDNRRAGSTSRRTGKQGAAAQKRDRGAEEKARTSQCRPVGRTSRLQLIGHLTTADFVRSNWLPERQFSGRAPVWSFGTILIARHRVFVREGEFDRAAASSSSSSCSCPGSSSARSTRFSGARSYSSAAASSVCSFGLAFPAASGSAVACQEARRVVPDAATGLRSVRVSTGPVGSAIPIKLGAGIKRSPSSAPARLRCRLFAVRRLGTCDVHRSAAARCSSRPPSISQQVGRITFDRCVKCRQTIAVEQAVDRARCRVESVIALRLREVADPGNVAVNRVQPTPGASLFGGDVALDRLVVRVSREEVLDPRPSDDCVPRRRVSSFRAAHRQHPHARLKVPRRGHDPRGRQLAPGRIRIRPTSRVKS